MEQDNEMETNVTDRQGIQVIARAAAILRRLEQEPEGCNLAELANQLELARSTVHRIVNALVDEGLVASAGSRAGFKLGPALLRMAASANVEIDRIARPMLQALARDLGETVDLSVLQGKTAVFVDQIPGSSRLVAMSATGETFPLYCTANGKALLACLPAKRRRQLLAGKLAALTPATITQADTIEAQIAGFHETQVALDLEEHTEGICAVGTSFIDPMGRDYAISVPVPATRFEEKRELVIARLLQTRQALFDALPGCSRPIAQ